MGRRIFNKNIYAYMPKERAGEKSVIEDHDVLKLIYTYRRDNPELSVYESGWEKCHNKHSYGPTRRTYYILHMIVKGKGEFTIENKTFHLSAGDLFLLPPEIVTYYKADSLDPWTYYWVGFNGLEAKKLLEASGFTEGQYTVKTDKLDKLESIMRNITQYSERNSFTEYGMLGYLYVLFSELMLQTEKLDGVKENDDYISKAIKYINDNFKKPLTIAEVAFYVGLDRSYFYKLFKTQMGVSPQEYLINVRMTKAQILLRDTDLNLNEIAMAVGYDNYSNFSKMFHKRYGKTPKTYAENPFENT